MPQNMDINDPPSKSGARFLQTTLKQPIGEIRSVDLNQEVSLEGDLDSDNQPTTPTPTQDTPSPQNQPRGETAKNKPEEVVADAADGETKPDATPATNDGDEVTFEEPDTVVDPQGRKLKEDGVTQETDANGKPIPEGPRNYNEFPDQTLVPVLKALNNTQYKKLEPVLRAVVEKAKRVETIEKQLQERPEKPVYSYENPEAYRLSKEYNELEQTIQIGNFELNHWEQQLLKIANGEPWQTLNYDQQGNPVYQTVPAPEDGKVDQRAMLQLQNHLGKLRPEVSRVEHQAQDFRATYQNQAKQSDAALEQIVQRVFPTLKDLSTIKPEEKTLLERAKAIIPPVFQGHPLVEKVFNRMVIFTERQKGKILSQAKEIQQLKSQLDDQKHSEPVIIPRGEGRTGGTGTGGKAFKYPDGRVVKSQDVVNFDDAL